MIEVLKPGLQSTVQDAGRRARALGVPGGGAADGVALRLANALVGNPAGAAALEITLAGPTLRFEQAALVALCGAPFDAVLDGPVLDGPVLGGSVLDDSVLDDSVLDDSAFSRRPFPMWRAVAVGAGQTLKLGGAARGMRAMLAVRGGLEAQEAFGSRSTDLRTGFGGHLSVKGESGRALRAGDRLTWPWPAPVLPPRAFLSPTLHTPFGPDQVVRVLSTPEATPEVLSALSRPFSVSAQADRMGVRLNEAVPAPHDPSRVSLPNVPGSVQLPPDGRPILLLPDAGTHGGYPTPLVVIRADLPRLGQLRPGDTLRFELCTEAEARAALLEQERGIRQAEWALRQWYGRGDQSYR